MTENVSIGVLHENYNAMLQWVVAMQHGYRLCDYLCKRGIKNIAVYGMNEIGNCIVRELINCSDVEFMYAIDQGSPKLYFDIPCYTLSSIPKDISVDLIIVALPYLYDKIRDDIEKVTGYKTISITELVYDMDY